MAERKATDTAPASGRALPFKRPTVAAVPEVNGYRHPEVMPREPEPQIAQGVDLSGKPKIVMAVGRGGKGKTTLLRWVSETALLVGSEFVLADIDPSNPTFSYYFEDVSRPDTDHPDGVREWLTALLEHAAENKLSAVVDLGGGDTTLRQIATDMPGLCDALEAAGIAPVVFYLAGREVEDLTPALTLLDRGFAPRAAAVVLNEYAMPLGQTREGAFARMVASKPYESLTASGAITLWMPRLFAAEAIEVRHAGFRVALEGKCKPPLGLVEGIRVRAWLEAMDRRMAGVRSWLP